MSVVFEAKGNNGVFLKANGASHPPAAGRGPAGPEAVEDSVSPLPGACEPDAGSVCGEGGGRKKAGPNRTTLW